MRTGVFSRLLFLTLACSGATAMAAADMPKQGTFDFNFCFVTDIDHIALSDDAGLGSFTNVAAMHGNPPGSPFDLQGARCFGYYSDVEGQYTESGYCEIKDADGDRWIMKFVSNPDGSGNWTVAGGVGKYAGMSASGKYRPLGMVPSAVAGKESRCNRNTGTYKLK